VAGQLDIVSSHGDVKVVYSTPPAAPLNITNDTGGVDVTLPEKSSFQIAAFSRSGQVDSDFEDPSLKTTDESEDGRLNGQFGGKSGTPGPKITITTSYGTIELHKGS
jgi:Putative adhesin